MREKISKDSGMALQFLQTFMSGLIEHRWILIFFYFQSLVILHVGWSIWNQPHTGMWLKGGQGGGILIAFSESLFLNNFKFLKDWLLYGIWNCGL